MVDLNPIDNFGNSAPGGLSGNDAHLSTKEVAAFAHAAGFSGAPLTTAVAIALAESNGVTNAKGGPNSNGSSDWGLFQINDIHKPTSTQKFDPLENSRVAVKLYSGRGNFKDWATYNSGSYKNKMSAAKDGVADYWKLSGKEQSAIVAKHSMYVKFGDGADQALGDHAANNDGIGGAISGAVNALTSTLFKIGINVGAVVGAFILLILGVIILSRTSVSKVAKAAGKVIP